MEKEMEAFIRIDNWMYHHSINDDWKDIIDDIHIIQKLPMLYPYKVYIVFGDVGKSDGDNILHVCRTRHDAEDWIEYHAPTPHCIIKEFDIN